MGEAEGFASREPRRGSLAKSLCDFNGAAEPAVSAHLNGGNFLRFPYENLTIYLSLLFLSFLLFTMFSGKGKDDFI